MILTSDLKPFERDEIMPNSEARTAANNDRTRELFEQIASLADSIEDLAKDVVSDLPAVFEYTEKLIAMRALARQAGALADAGAVDTGGFACRETATAWLLGD